MEPLLLVQFPTYFALLRWDGPIHAIVPPKDGRGFWGDVSLHGRLPHKGGKFVGAVAGDTQERRAHPCLVFSSRMLGVQAGVRALLRAPLGNLAIAVDVPLLLGP